MTRDLVAQRRERILLEQLRNRPGTRLEDVRALPRCAMWRDEVLAAALDALVARGAIVEDPTGAIVVLERSA